MTWCFDWTTILLFYQRDVKFTDQNELDGSMVSWADRQTAYKLYISRWSAKECFCLRVKFFNYFGKRSIFLNETNCSENIQLYILIIFFDTVLFFFLLHRVSSVCQSVCLCRFFYFIFSILFSFGRYQE